MVLPREQTPFHPRRRPTAPPRLARSRGGSSVFPRSSPPPSATPTPPPTSLNLAPFTSAFDPLHMIASPSSATPVRSRLGQLRCSRHRRRRSPPPPRG
jgi:hypothetical protein